MPPPQLGTVDAATALQPRGAPYFLAATLALPQLADPAFVAAYLPRREGAETDCAVDSSECFCALTAATPLDRADAAAVTPDGAHCLSLRSAALRRALRPPRRVWRAGTLHLSLCAESYARLGVPGRKAAATRGGKLASTPPRYAASLRLNGANFAPGRRHYERVTQCMRECAAPLRFLVARTVDGCSADVAFPPAAAASRHPLRPASRRVTRLTLPPLASAFGGDADAAAAAASDAALLHALHDWLGAVATGAAGEVGADAALWRHTPADATGADGDDDVADDDAGGWPLGAPWAGTRDGWAQTHRWQGLLAPAHVAHAVATARRAVASGAAPWAAVSAWGFRDSPVAWLPPPGGEEPPPRGAGANDACLLLLPKDRWLLLTIDAPDA